LKPSSGPLQDAAIETALKSLDQHPVAKSVKALAKGLASFDWRTSAEPSLSPTERQLKLGFRGSGGYKELRHQLLDHLAKRGGVGVADTASSLLESVG
jgi:hypothetical protein